MPFVFEKCMKVVNFPVGKIWPPLFSFRPGVLRRWYTLEKPRVSIVRADSPKKVLQGNGGRFYFPAHQPSKRAGVFLCAACTPFAVDSY